MFSSQFWDPWYKQWLNILHFLLKHKLKCGHRLYVDSVFPLMIPKCVLRMYYVYYVLQHSRKQFNCSSGLFLFVIQCWFEFEHIMRKEKVMNQRCCLQGLYLTAGCLFWNSEYENSRTSAITNWTYRCICLTIRLTHLVTDFSFIYRKSFSFLGLCVHKQLKHSLK